MRKRTAKQRKATKEWLKTPAGRRWVERKIEEKHHNRPDPGPPAERFTRTKFPFIATVNGRRVEVRRSSVRYLYDHE